MWCHNETESNLIHKDEIFIIFIINMYITKSILHWVNCNLIHFYEFATKRNTICVKLTLESVEVFLNYLWKL